MKMNCNDNSGNIKLLISDLGSKKQDVREKARSLLMSCGESALKDLITSLTDQNANIRWESGKIIESGEFNWDHVADKQTIQVLIHNLTSNDGFVRLSSRNSLIKIGTKAVPSLIDALSGKEELKRWEAIKALSLIGDPAALNALVNAMDDKVFDVRWVAAEGLIALGNRAIEPLLHLAMTHADSIRLREGVHHVLYALNIDHPNEFLKPVIEALEASEATIQVPFAAEKALEELKSQAK
jgi:HEAT repeat protein